jgi:trans-aconitate 2-methyltransferase
MWDTTQYAKFSNERSRPFFDLAGQIAHDNPRTVTDLGCGTGELTRTLADRWPRAQVTAIDNSTEMLTKAAGFAIPGGLEFTKQDISEWSPKAPVDVILSNAALQWIADHAALFPRLVGFLAPGGVLAVQMPQRFRAASQSTIDEVAADPRWSQRLTGAGLHPDSVMPVDWYVHTLRGLGCTVNAWETTYVHVLTGENPVLEWFKGTALRPLLARLNDDERVLFEKELGGRLRKLYPERNGVTLFPFPRVFVVAVKAA